LQKVAVTLSHSRTPSFRNTLLHPTPSYRPSTATMRRSDASLAVKAERNRRQLDGQEAGVLVEQLQVVSSTAKDHLTIGRFFSKRKTTDVVATAATLPPAFHWLVIQPAQERRQQPVLPGWRLVATNVKGKRSHLQAACPSSLGP
jgi:hypothetical protein